MNAHDLCSCGHVPATAPNPECERCCLVWFAHQTGLMRSAQKKFFKTSRGDDLQESRRLESLVDKAFLRLNEIPSQKELF